MRPSLVDIEVAPKGPPKRMLVIGVPTRGMVSIRWMVSMQALQAPMNMPVCQLHTLGLEVGVACPRRWCSHLIAARRCESAETLFPASAQATR